MNKFSGVLFLLVVLVSSASAQNYSKVSNDEAKNWREDLSFLSLEMPKKHPNLFHTLKEEDFWREVKNLNKKIPELSRHEIIVEMARIVALIGDGHTVLPLMSMHHGEENKIGFRQFPLNLYLFDDGLFVKAATSEYKEIVGGKIVKIGKTDVDEAIRIVSKIVARDNEMTVKDRLPALMVVPEVLHALKLTDNLEETPFTVQINGEQKTVILESPTDNDKNPWVEAREDSKTPLWLKKPWDPYWFEYLAQSKTLYFQYNSVGDREKGEKLADFFKRLFKFIETGDVERLVIDLRLNSGGNGVYNWGLIYGLIRSEKINQKGRLFVITGRKTFSAGVNAAALLDFHTKAIFIGEPTGGNVNSYGDHVTIKLPNSGIEVLVSQYFYQNTYPWDKREWIKPDIEIKNSFEDFRKNRDAALDSALNYIPK